MKKLAVKKCDPYYGVSVEQVKKYLARKGAGHAARMKYMQHTNYRQSGKSVLADHLRFRETSLYRCENGRIVGYSNYEGLLR